MRTIKAREHVSNIKILDRSANLSSRMRDSFVRTKESAEETREQQSASPSDYAIDSIQDKAQGAAQNAIQHFPDPREKISKNIERTKSNLHEVKRQRPAERRRASEQAQKNAQMANDRADELRKSAENAKKTADKAKDAVTDAKQALKQVRIDANHSLAPDITRPGYLNKGIKSTRSAVDTVKSVEQSAKGVKATAKGTIKTAEKTIKTAEQSAKVAIKTAQQSAKTAQKSAVAAAKAAKVAEHAARAAAKAAAQTAKATAKAVTAMVKAVIAAIKGLVAAIAAGGWVAVLVIIIICLVGLLVGSIFGIFFSSEPNAISGLTVNGVIREINTEYTTQIDDIVYGNAHDQLDMSGARAGWKQVLAVYTVRTVSDPDNPMEVATMNDEKAEILRVVFWDMNTISHQLDTVEVEVDVLGDDGLPTGETTTDSTTVLRIFVSHKTPEEIAEHYGFDAEQRAWLEELLKPEYHTLWNGLLYGITSIGDGSMISVAETQLGNIGGEPYWSWYGFTSREEWCACFVSWCAEQCGFIEAGIVPMFAWCPSGAQWFMDRGQWQDNTYTPSTGDIIFFDWEADGECDHVGIVESVADGMVNTIEGNTSDSCARRSYALGSVKIFGYGIPVFQ